MDIVHLLPDHVANQIAAGEVIQRPASCLKELVENSLDAGATHIQILLRDAGRTSLQVIDNGSGMSPMDARMAFERHATSKIQQAADLFSLHTMGFRGEALASICAVAQVELLTRQASDELGTRLEIHGSEVVCQEPVQCPVGTNLKVKNLFFNVPARRKFLKTDQTEMRNLLSDFYRIVLVYPEVQFTLVSNDEIVMDLPASNYKQRIEGVFGKSSRQSFTSQLVDLRSDNELIHIHGFVGKPEFASRNPQQYFFVNGRYMRHAYFHKAVMNAYQGLLTADVAPSYFIYFDIDPNSIDVNIHPTKTEIKFADEQLIFPLLMATVREALGKFNVSPSLDFDVAGRVEMPVIRHTEHLPFTPPQTTHTTDYNPFRQPVSVPSGWQNIYPEPRPSAPVSSLEQPSVPEIPVPISFSNVVLSQVVGKYIVVPAEEGILFVNQHRAHLCILYSTCLRRLSDHDGEVQQLLFPDIWEIDKQDQSLVESLQEDLRGVGFDMTPLTPLSYSVTGVPAILSGRSALKTLSDILDSLRDTGIHNREQWKEKIALSLAEGAAIPYGKNLTQQEMQHLLDDLFALPSYEYTPDGKAVVVQMSSDQISKLF